MLGEKPGLVSLCPRTLQVITASVHVNAVAGSLDSNVLTVKCDNTACLLREVWRWSVYWTSFCGFHIAPE